MVQCPNCGKILEDGTKFCPDCGTKIPAAVPPEQNTDQFQYGNTETSAGQSDGGQSYYQQPDSSQNTYQQPNAGQYDQNTYQQPNGGQYGYQQQDAGQAAYTQGNNNQQYYNPNAGANPGMNQGMNYGTSPEGPQKGANGNATAGLICGIASMPCGLIPILGLTLGVLGIVLGVSGKKKGQKKSFATAATICGIIGIVISVIVWIVSFSVIFSDLTGKTASQPASGITAGSSESGSDTIGSGSSDNSGSSDKSGSSNKSDSSSDSSFASDSLTYIKKLPTFEQKVLVDQGGLKITATGIEEDRYAGVKVNLLIENNTSNDLNISSQTMSVNNYMMDGSMYSSVVSGKKSNDYLRISYSDLNASEITNIGEIDIDFNVMDAASYDSVIITADPLQTSDYASMDTKAVSSGEEILNQDGLRIMALTVDSDGYYVNVYYYIENTTGRDITIDTEDTSVNGYMMTAEMYNTIKNGKKAVAAMRISQNDLTSNSISTIDEFEVTFDIRDNSTYEELGTVGPITFTINGDGSAFLYDEEAPVKAA